MACHSSPFLFPVALLHGAALWPSAAERRDCRTTSSPSDVVTMAPTFTSSRKSRHCQRGINGSPSNSDDDTHQVRLMSSTASSTEVSS